MDRLWYIHAEGGREPTGPLNAREIRQGLREGRFDPFDLVSRGLAGNRQELVEVDEIFADVDEHEDAGEDAQDGAKANLRRTQVSAYEEPSPAAKATQLSGDVSSVEDAPRGHGLHLAYDSGLKAAATSRHPQPSHQEKALQGRRREPKSYYLVDASGHVLGPLSAREIQGMFYKGVLSKNVQVMKNGTSTKVPVAKFVSVYAQTAKGGGASYATPSFQGRPSGMPSKVHKALARHDISLLLWAYALAALFAIFAGIIFWRQGGPEWLAAKWRDDRRQAERESDVLFLDDAGHGPPRAAPRASLREKSPEEGGALKRPSAKRVPRQKIKEVKELSKAKEARTTRRADSRAALRQKQVEAQRRQKQQAEREAAQRRRGADEARAYRQRIAAQAAKKQFSPAPAPSKAALKQQAPVSKTAPVAAKASPPPAKAAALLDGQQISGYGPVNYDPKAVSSCMAACTVSFSGPSGTVRGKFFKGAFGDVLAQKGGKARLSGMVRVQGGQTVVIITGVE